MEKVYYPNTTQVSNFVLDNMYLFSDGELRILLLITRKTIGWHKETDFLRYSQLLSLTGIKSKTTISNAITSLIDKELIERVNNNGNIMPMGQTGYRGEIFYTLNKGLVQNLDKLKSNYDLSKNLTSTSPKNGQYKTNSNKTNKLASQKIKKEQENVDNTGINEETLPTNLTNGKNVDKKPSSLKPLREIVLQRTNIFTGKNEETMRMKLFPVKTAHQAYGLEVITTLLLPPNYKSRVMRACKNRPLHIIENAVEATVKKQLQLADERAKYFFKVLSNQ